MTRTLSHNFAAVVALPLCGVGEWRENLDATA